MWRYSLQDINVDVIDGRVSQIHPPSRSGAMVVAGSAGLALLGEATFGSCPFSLDRAAARPADDRNFQSDYAQGIRTGPPDFLGRASRGQIRAVGFRLFAAGDLGQVDAAPPPSAHHIVSGLAPRRTLQSHRPRLAAGRRQNSYGPGGKFRSPGDRHLWRRLVLRLGVYRKATERLPVKRQ